MVDQLRPGDPRQMGPYRLTGRLGGGGMGEVYLGRSAGGRLVAVKVIRPELAADPEFRARFRHEVAAARSVNGLYTAPVADAQVDGSMPWLATAYVQGPSLAAAVEEHGPLPARSVLALAAGLAEGLAAVHAAGLVHRDLKPSNVLLASDGPRVIDFGIARGTQATVLTMAGHIIGSPDFMSPEQATGRELGPPTDVFSLGAVLTYAATGHAPFRAAETTTLLGRIVNDEPDLSRVPAQVRPMIQWCLAKDPAARPTPLDLLSRLGEVRVFDDWLPDSMLTQTMRTPPGGLPETPRPARPVEETPVRDTVDAPTPPPPGVPRAAPTTPAVPLAPVTKDAPAEFGDTTRPPARTSRTRVRQNGDDGGHRAGPRRWSKAWLAAAVVVVLAAGVGLWLGLSGSNSHNSSSQSHTGATSSSSASASPFKFATAAGATAFPCSAALASTSGGTTTHVTFSDSTTQPVKVYWLSYTGKATYIVTVAAGDTKQITGNIGDAWEVAGPSGCAGEFVTTAATQITVQTPAYG